ncbi:MAG: zinc ribbon domain-containing protein [Ruminococcus sp.]|nr:zinc ribbon domain-containing protein [Ruminococcus sp.]
MGFMDKVKDFADKASDSVMKGAKNASDGVKKLQEKSDYKRKISVCESEIKDAYVEIGRRYFEANPESAEFSELYQIIIDNNAKMNEYKEQLAAMDDKASCPSCGASIAKDAKFCDKCGARIETPVEIQTEAKPVSKFCSECGAPLSDGSKFCETCGTPVEEEKTDGENL